MKENTRLYRKIRLLRLHARNSIPQYQAHKKLETLEELAMSVCDLEATGDAATIPKPIQVVET